MCMLSDLEQDALRESMNIAAGRAADAMSRLFGMRVYMHITRLHVLSQDDLPRFLVEEVGQIGSVTAQSFFGDLNGTALLLVPREHAVQMIRILTNEDVDVLYLSSSDRSVLAEISNIVLSACVSTLVRQLDAVIRFRLPQVKVNLQGTQASAFITAMAKELDYQVLLLSTQLRIGSHRIEAYIMIILMLGAEDVRTLLRAVISGLD